MSNPLIGNRISLISKKNIRYEGILYTINQSDSTVALKDVKSFGTEGRATAIGEPEVGGVDVVHEYLLFRGCDIKDLHVHDSNNPPPAPAVADPSKDDPAIMSTKAPPALQKQQQQQKQKSHKNGNNGGDDFVKFDSFSHHGNESSSGNKDVDTFGASAVQQQKNKSQSNRSNQNGQNSRQNNRDIRDRQTTRNQNNPRQNTNQRPRQTRQPSTNNRQQPANPRPQQPSGPIGSGKSLASRKLRGAGDGPAIATGTDFDLTSAAQDLGEVDLEVEEEEIVAYSKDNFFDDLSCDQKDKANGVNNRLRGQAEKDLNLEAFGAVSLGGGDRRGGRGGRRNNRGGREGRGGRGEGGYRNNRNGDNRNRNNGGGNRGNNRYRDSDGMPKPSNQSQSQTS